MAEYTHIVHPFQPLYNADSTILILGSLPSVKSREQGFYYGHPRNRFWAMLAGVWKEQMPVTVEEKQDFILSHHLALYDAIESCDIAGSSDSSIRNVKPAVLEEIMEHAGILKILANGKTAGKYFCKYQKEDYQKIFKVMPSTSPANAAVSLEKLIDCWSVELLGQNNRSEGT